MLMYRGCKEGCGGQELIGYAKATTTDWSGTYDRIFDTPIFPNDPNEDPFLWQDKRGNFHALFHSLEPGVKCILFYLVFFFYHFCTLVQPMMTVP